MPKPGHSPRIRVGISSCLLGEKVRFDGGHKREPFLTDTLAAHVEWVPVCPEVEMGLGTPRETLRLIRQAPGEPLRMVTTRTAIDHTDGMNNWARGRLEQLARDEPDLCGYVLKKDSPSCGMLRVKTYSGDAMPERNGVGLYASALLRRFPLLPVEEEGRLNDPRLRENFIERVYSYRRLKDLFVPGWSLGDLMQVPHRAQDGAARAFDDALQRDGTARRARKGPRRERVARRL